MTKKGVNYHIIKRIKDMFEERDNKIKINNEVNITFLIEKIVKQGCPLSDTLIHTIYNILVGSRSTGNIASL